MAEKHQARLIEDSDILWLRDRFSKLREKDPELDVDAFALSHGVDPKLLKPEDFTLNAAILWHGTTEDRAVKILQEGFKVKQTTRVWKRKIWFTTKHNEARGIARFRGKRRNQPPIVFECAIDLNQYHEYTRPIPRHYVFETNIGPETIRHPRVIKESAVAKRTAPPRPVPRTGVPDICITRQSGRTGIAFWLNAFFQLAEDEAFQVDSAMVLELEDMINQHFEVSDEQILPAQMADITEELVKGSP